MVVAITATGKYLPERIVNNTEIVEIFRQHGVTTTPSGKPLTANWIESLIGIKERRWAREDQNTSDLALAAANQALKKRGIKWGDLSVIEVGSSSPEAFFPSTACFTLEKGVGPRVEAADTLAACTSGLYAAVHVQRALLCEENYRYGLAIGAEVLASRMTDFHDINADLWGDGAAAIVLEKVSDEQTQSGIICSILGSDPSMTETTHSIGKGTRPTDSLTQPNIFLKGHEVQRFVLQIVPQLIPATICKANRILTRQNKATISLKDVDLFILHQANGRIFEKPAEKLAIPLEKFYRNVERYANTSSAAVLICLCEAIEEGRIGPGNLVMLVSFGGGLTWGSLLLRL